MKAGINYSLGYIHISEPPGVNDTTKSGSEKKEPILIKLLQSDKVSQREDMDYQLILGNVIFLHDGAYLYCDSAHYSSSKGIFDAFSNVKMVQGDTIFLYGDYMRYDGNTKKVKVRRNVKLENVPQNVQLYTDSLDYDRVHNIGYYFHGGRLEDALNVLKSIYGQYEPNHKTATFIKDVVVTNENFTLYSDTLLYNTGNKIATIMSQSKIVSDSGTIYTSRGWHNTDTQESLLLKQSTVENKEGNRTLKGDSIFYNKAKGYIEVFGNMNLMDTTKKIVLRGNYGFYNEITDYCMATDSAYTIEYSQGDSLFIHADTLKLNVIPRQPNIVEKKLTSHQPNDSVAANKPVIDSVLAIQQDSVAIIPQKVIYDREIKAYHGVRFYRTDMQGVCDSMQFNTRDSVLHLYREPVLWNENNQLSGDTIDVYLNDSTIRLVHVKRYSFSIQQKDSLMFNQLKGRSLKAFFEEGKIRRILVEGNAESIFYPEEKDKSIIGLNWLESSYLEIRMKDGAFERLKTWSKSTGKMTPTDKIESIQRKLIDFYWYDYLRPTDRYDILRKVSKKSTDTRPKRSAIFDRED